MELDHEFTIPVPVDRAWSTLLDVERVAPCVPGATLDSIDGDEFIGRLQVKLGAMTITYRGTAQIIKADESARTVTIEGSAKEARGSGTASVTVQARLRAVDAAGADADTDQAADEAGQATQVTVHTKLSVTGRPAQFGRGILSEVGGKLIARFAKALSAELAAGATTAAPQQAPPTPQPATPELAATPEPAPTPEPAARPEPAGELSAEPTAAAPVARREPAADHAPEPAHPAARQPAEPGEDAIDLFEVAGPSVAKRVAPVAAGVIAALTVWRVFRRRRGRHHR